MSLQELDKNRNVITLLAILFCPMVAGFVLSLLDNFVEWTQAGLSGFGLYLTGLLITCWLVTIWFAPLAVYLLNEFRRGSSHTKEHTSSILDEPFPKP